jgi:hypothetical protein
MRLRNENLKTGKALAWTGPDGAAKPTVLLFLVSGASDIAPLNATEAACRSLIEDRGYPGFAWHAIADPGHISAVDPRLFRAGLVRFEAREFDGLGREQIECLLAPVLEHVVKGDSELLPRAGGAVGGPAEGIQFLNRVRELENLAGRIRAGQSLFLQAPRRMGKTSLMRRLETLLADEFSVVALNFERDPSPAECAARLRSLSSAEGFRAALTEALKDPSAVARESLTRLCARETRPLLVFVDELVALLETIRTSYPVEEERRRETLAFLAALGDPLVAHGARLVAAGSIDALDYLAREFGLRQSDLPSPFRDMERVPLKPLDLQDPECELRRVLLGSDLVAEPDEIRWLCEHVDLTVPFPALRFLDVLAGETKRRVSVSRPDLAQLLREFLTDTDSFSDFDEHLRRKCPHVPRAPELIAEALTLVARGPFDEGASDEEVNAVLRRCEGEAGARIETWLKETFPVSVKGGRWRFVSRLFRAWWRHQMSLDAEDDA